MRTEMNYFEIGDVVSTPKGPITHYGIYTGQGRVTHNSPRNKQVVEEPIESFSSGNSVRRHDIMSPLSREQICQNAKSMIGTQYKLLSQNCEHFVRTVLGLKPESLQLQKYSIATVGTTIAFRSSNPTFRTIAAATSVAALLTPENESPMKFAFAGLLIGATIMALARA